MRLKSLRRVMKLFAGQVLVFPVAVTALASLSLICGGSCALWQWWVAVAGVIAAPFIRHDWRKAAAAGAWFLGFLFFVWLYTGITVTIAGYDQATCHYPAIRLLMLGWNPVWQSSPEAICRVVNLNPEDFKLLWVVASPKPVWYFCAVANFFTKNPFSLCYPILLFMLVATGATVWRNLKGANVLLKVFAVLALASMILRHHYFLDAVMALSVIGLLSCLYRYLEDGEYQPIPLIVFSFWACSGKPLGILFCAIAWTVFFAVVLIKERQSWKGNIVRFAKIHGLIAFLVIAANVSPYITSWVEYSHPFYPKCTMNPEKYPAVELTGDFLDVNDDAKQMMNRPAMFINAFVSPELVRRYYAWKLDKPDFRPQGQTWRQFGYPDGFDTPLRAELRYWFIAPILLMLVFGGLPGRFVAVVMLLCILMVPTEMIGFERYVRYIQCAVIFTLPIVDRLMARARPLKWILLCVITLLCWSKLCDCAKLELDSLDRRLGNYELFESGLPETVYYNREEADFQPEANLDLLKLFVPALQAVKLARIPDYVYENSPRPDTIEWQRSFCFSFRAPKWYPSRKYSAILRAKAKEPKPKGEWAGSLYEFKMFWKCLAATMPRAVLLRLTGRLDNHLKGASEIKVKSHGDVIAENAAAKLSGWCSVLSYTGSKDGSATMTGRSPTLKVVSPQWLKNDKGQGLVIVGEGLSGKCKLRCKGEGDVSIALRGIDVRNGTEKLPVYADYASFKINGKEMLKKKVSVWNRTPHRISLHVKDGEVLKLSFRLKPHKYERAELRQLLLDMADQIGTGEDMIDAVLSSPIIKPFLRGQ